MIAVKKVLINIFLITSLMVPSSLLSMLRFCRLAPLAPIKQREPSKIEVSLRLFISNSTHESGLAKEILGLIKENSWDINKADGLGYTPLGIAQDRGSIELIELLIVHGATYEETLLSRLKERFAQPIISSFLAFLLHQDPKRSLETALKACDIQMIRTLLELGANKALIKGEAGAIAMKRAIKSGNEELGVFLINYGVDLLTPIYRYEKEDVHNYKITLAHLAAEYGCTEIMAAFLETLHVDINDIVTIFNETLLHYAVVNTQTDVHKTQAMIELLRSYGAQELRHRYGETPTDWLQRRTGSKKLLQALASPKSSPNKEDPRETLPSSPISTVPERKNPKAYLLPPMPKSLTTACYESQLT